MTIRILLSLFLSFTVFCLLNGITESLVGKQADDTLIVAHRGASALAPENTISAFDMAVSLGADYIEVDVQMTKDGMLVAMHDVTVNRTTNGSGRIKSLTYEELAALDAGSWFSPKFKGERVPALETILERYIGRIGILIEIKHPSIYPGIEEELASALSNKLPEDGPPSPLIVQSFDRQSIQEFHRLLPVIPTGIIVGDSEFSSGEDLFAIDGFATFINPKAALVDADFMQRAKERNLNVLTWTVSDSKTAQSLRNLNVNGIITNYPAEQYYTSVSFLEKTSLLVSAITFLAMLFIKK
ncbi:glycerophosphodiester phosphodiesterase [Bacillus salacetis]|uniref:Glycerophosphodiester phosphodiesterase n=1 Tax=Bacillus salacetis TaxID=2315464 RepID=A0A3A1QUU2_9BACI|nr:glycerophosphodiester phosphodiesterase family protein [Bacillus salacetis]RIW29589.1 glycerophosphodiester phosphodiesterase [Bacillus salacetis]